MTIFNSQDRARAWREAAAATDPTDRDYKRRVLASAVFELIASKLGFATDEYAEALIKTFDLLDATGLIDNHILRENFAAIDDEDARPARVFLDVLARDMHAAAGDPRADPAVIIELLELARFWEIAATARPASSAADHDEVYLSVAEVAAKYAVTRQAVYKWIHNGLLGARSRPGGSYQIPESALTGLNRPT